MSTNTTNTYQMAKSIYENLGLKEDVCFEIEEIHVPLLRKHLSEMVKRQQSSNKYASRYKNGKVKIIRIE